MSKNPHFLITVTYGQQRKRWFRFPYKLVADLIVDAVEGLGTNWIESLQIQEPECWTFKEDVAPVSEGSHRYQNYPFNKGGALLITTNDKQIHVLDKKSIKKGLILMSKYHFPQFMQIEKKEYNSLEADMWLQFALFGKKRY